MSDLVVHLTFFDLQDRVTFLRNVLEKRLRRVFQPLYLSCHLSRKHKPLPSPYPFRYLFQKLPTVLFDGEEEVQPIGYTKLDADWSLDAAYTDWIDRPDQSFQLEVFGISTIFVDREEESQQGRFFREVRLVPVQAYGGASRLEKYHIPILKVEVGPGGTYGETELTKVRLWIESDFCFQSRRNGLPNEVSADRNLELLKRLALDIAEETRSHFGGAQCHLDDWLRPIEGERVHRKFADLIEVHKKVLVPKLGSSMNHGLPAPPHS